MGKGNEIFKGQQQHWEGIYRSDRQGAEANTPTEFAAEVLVKACLGEGFKVETLQSGTANFNGRTAGFVKVIARKRAER